MRTSTRSKSENPKVRSVSLLTLDEAGARLSLSPWTIRRWAQHGRIPSVKISNRLLIPETAVEALITANYREADAPAGLRMV